MDANETAATWKALADSYETARTRPDSFDVLMEFPAQLSLIGDVAGKRILDLACGSGAKAIYLARQGAGEVVGVDISETFIEGVAGLQPPPTPASCAATSPDSMRSRVSPVGSMSFCF